MENNCSVNLIKKSLFANNTLAAALVIMYCIVYGAAAHAIFEGLQLMFFISSLIFAVGAIYVRDPEVQKAKIKNSIIYNQVAGALLAVSYILIFGVSSVALYTGFKFIFFMTSYVFVLSFFYLRDPKRIEAMESVSYSETRSPFQERTPCFIKKEDLSWLVRELNEPLASIIGFTELMLRREFNQNEIEYMLRNIYQQSLSMSHSINKVSHMIDDSPIKPKEIHDVVNLLDDRNFK